MSCNVPRPAVHTPVDMGVVTACAVTDAVGLLLRGRWGRVAGLGGRLAILLVGYLLSSGGILNSRGLSARSFHA